MHMRWKFMKVDHAQGDWLVGWFVDCAEIVPLFFVLADLVWLNMWHVTCYM
jgi:hypothetical protein